MFKKQNGFGVAGLMLVVLVLGTITILGMYFLKKSDENRSNSSDPKPYQNKTFSFSFEYPGDYEPEEILANNNVVHLQLKSGNSRPDVLISASKISYEKDAYNSVGSILNGTHNRNKNVISKPVKLSIDGLPAVEYERRDGNFHRIIQIDTKDNTYSFALNVSDGMAEEHIEMLRKIANSFKVNK